MSYGDHQHRTAAIIIRYGCMLRGVCWSPCAAARVGPPSRVISLARQVEAHHEDAADTGYDDSSGAMVLLFRTRGGYLSSRRREYNCRTSLKSAMNIDNR
jgi:hypothetical protein